jgi:hypothetical protein
VLLLSENNVILSYFPNYDVTNGGATKGSAIFDEFVIEVMLVIIFAVHHDDST